MIIQECYFAVGASHSADDAIESAYDAWARYKNVVAEGLGASRSDVDKYVQVVNAVPSLVVYEGWYTAVVVITYSYEDTVAIGSGFAITENDDTD